MINHDGTLNIEASEPLQIADLEAYLSATGESVAGQEEVIEIQSLARTIDFDVVSQPTIDAINSLANLIVTAWDFSVKLPQTHTTGYNLSHGVDKSFMTGDCILPTGIFYEMVKNLCDIGIYCLPKDYHPYLLIKLSTNGTNDFLEVHFPPHPFSDDKPAVANVNSRSTVYVEETFVDSFMQKFPDLLAFLRYSDIKKIRKIIDSDIKLGPLQKAAILSQLEKINH